MTKPAQEPRIPPKVHVIDQSGQPYGSERRCCNRCGAMKIPGMRYVDSISRWLEWNAMERCSP